MHWLDLSIFIVYMLAMMGIGVYFHYRNKNLEDFFVGGRKMGSWHVGLSVVATDVGGGFSIGLGGLGFIMGLSGSWMLFTGLIGAWLSAVILIPRIKALSQQRNLYTFPQVFESYFNKNVALVAGIISAIGYLGFTSSQLLAGAKLASATFNGLDLNMALLIMGFIAIGYTVLGGLKAVIYTDTLQWMILIIGLVFIGLPVAFSKTGGMQGLMDHVDPEFLSLTNLRWQDFVNWMITILPIWFVGMTLYQRIYASRSVREAKRAWYIAGLFEWPVMAFLGVMLGLFGRVAFEQGVFTDAGYATMADIDPEMGLPLLLRHILPVGLMGLMLSAYFSAILSTADSCLIAASGNILTDIIGKIMPIDTDRKKTLNLSKILTLIIGAFALMLALKMETVLDLMLYSYAFMVSGLLVPVLSVIFLKKPNTYAAFASMITGGSVTLILTILAAELPLSLAPNIFGITGALLAYVIVDQYVKTKNRLKHGI
jgi:SSS family solute:Na+ symporter